MDLNLKEKVIFTLLRLCILCHEALLTICFIKILTTSITSNTTTRVLFRCSTDKMLITFYRMFTIMVNDPLTSSRFTKNPLNRTNIRARLQRYRSKKCSQWSVLWYRTKKIITHTNTEALMLLQLLILPNHKRQKKNSPCLSPKCLTTSPSNSFPPNHLSAFRYAALFDVFEGLPIFFRSYTMGLS